MSVQALLPGQWLVRRCFSGAIAVATVVFTIAGATFPTAALYAAGAQQKTAPTVSTTQAPSEQQPTGQAHPDATSAPPSPVLEPPDALVSAPKPVSENEAPAQRDGRGDVLSAQKAHKKAVLINPVGPLVSLIASVLGVRSVLLSATYLHAVSSGVAISVTPVWANVNFLVDLNMVGLKLGPRLGGLAGRYFTPVGTLGWGWIRNSRGRLLNSAPLLGLGFETGYLWRWQHFILELGGGLHTTTVLQGASEAKSGNRDLGIKPFGTLRLGYGW